MVRKLAEAIFVGACAALLAAVFLAGSATANSCAAQCHAAHNQCRIATKGSPSCDAQLTSCLRSCAGRK